MSKYLEINIFLNNPWIKEKNIGIIRITSKSTVIKI